MRGDGKPRTPSIRALMELKCMLSAQCDKAHKQVTDYGSRSDETKITRLLEQRKKEIRKTLAKSIEDYAVKTFPEYGLESVVVCKRHGGSGNDTLDVELKVTKYPGTEELELKKEVGILAYEADQKRIDDWYWAALQAVAAHETLPVLPEFVDHDT